MQLLQRRIRCRAKRCRIEKWKGADTLDQERRIGGGGDGDDDTTMTKSVGARRGRCMRLRASRAAVCVLTEGCMRSNRHTMPLSLYSVANASVRLK